jgi:hypothetical protein
VQIDLAPLSVLGRPRHRPTDGITIYPVERFGNQLFTYAAGLSQARRLGCPLHVSLGFYGPYAPKRNYSFSYGLDVFDNGIERTSSPEADRPIFRGLPPSATGRVLTQTVGRRSGPLVGGVFIERAFTYDPLIEEIPVGTTLLGFFQSWRYFERVADEVRTRMLTIREPSPWYDEMRRTITPGDRSVILNVRRGDYVLPETQAYQGLARRSYYERALDLVRQLGATGTVYLMTDSMDDVLEEFVGMADLVPIRPPRGTEPLEMLGVLAQADALVAGNSTFSWWGGFLGERPGRHVIAPRPWFTVSHLDTRDLLLPGWITLDREH